MFNIKDWEVKVSYAFTELITSTDKEDAIKRLEETKEFINVLQELLNE